MEEENEKVQRSLISLSKLKRSQNHIYKNEPKYDLIVRQPKNREYLIVLKPSPRIPQSKKEKSQRGFQDDKRKE